MPKTKKKTKSKKGIKKYVLIRLDKIQEKITDLGHDIGDGNISPNKTHEKLDRIYEEIETLKVYCFKENTDE